MQYHQQGDYSLLKYFGTFYLPIFNRETISYFISILIYLVFVLFATGLACVQNSLIALDWLVVWDLPVSTHHCWGKVWTTEPAGFSWAPGMFVRQAF